MDLLNLLLSVSAALALAKGLGFLARKAGQPPVLGELAAGLPIAAGMLPFFDPGSPALHWLAEAGLVVLLIETGRHCDPRKLAQAGPAAAGVAVIGVVVPFVLGWAVMAALGRGGREAVFVGAALTATSVGITARVLADLGKLAAPETLIILGAAVLDDVIGIGLLAALQGFSFSGALVIAAFAGGIALGRSGRDARASELLEPLGEWLTPLFFVMVGARVSFGAVAAVPALLLLAAAVAGKLASGLAVRDPALRRWAVGAGMIPRGEVGLVFAGIGLSAGALDPGLYGAVVLMAVATTFLAPPLLKKAFA